MKRTGKHNHYNGSKIGPFWAIPMEAPLPVHVTVVIPTRNEEEAIVDTIRSVPNDGWCQKLDFLVIDGNSEDRTRELAEEEGATVYLEGRKGYGRAYRTGFQMAPGSDCDYGCGLHLSRGGGTELVRRLLEDDLQFITCDRLRKAEDGAMSGLHGFGNWALSFTARMLFFYGIHDSQSGMWVFRKEIMDNLRMRPTNDGMPLGRDEDQCEEVLRTFEGYRGVSPLPY